MLEVTTFRLVDGADDAAFVAADAAVQTGCYYAQPGLLRRTTARALPPTEGWVVVTLWRSPGDADAAAAAVDADPLGAAWWARVERGSVDTRRYDTLD